MLSEKKLLEKLYAQPEIFNKHIENKEYAQADYCVECARIVAWFMELSEEQLTELFGSKQDSENIVEGLFAEEKVLRAMEWCIFHNKTRQDLIRQDREERQRVWIECNKNKSAKEYLTRLKDIDKVIETINKEITYIKMGITPSASKTDAVRSSINGIAKPTEQEAVSLTELQEQLHAYREEYIALKTTATRLIGKIKNNTYQMVLYKYYLHNMTLYETAEEMNLSYQRICTLRNKAIEEFRKLMDAEEIVYPF